MNRTMAIAAGLAFWIAAGAAQQAPPSPTPPAPFRSGVEIVTLDVSVFDDNRQPVRGLTAADFTIVENGKSLPIVAFEAIDLPDRRAFAAPWMRDVAPDVVTNNMDAERVVVLLLDDFNVSMDPAEVATTKTLAHTIIKELGPADVAAVVYTFTHEKSQDFTADRARLLAAVDRFKSSAFPTIPGVPTMACAHNECVTSALRSIATVLQDGWPGRRKTIAYVSPEGRYSLGPGNIEQVAFEANASIWNSTPDLQRTFRAMQEANVNVYQYDPRGLMESLDILNSIGMFADNTGGRTVTRTNAPEQRVTEMFVENSSYYMLGFQPTSAKADGKFRPVTVKVSRPDVEVRTRSGYYGPTVTKPEKPTKNPPSILDKAMAGTLPSGELPMTLTVAPFAVPGPVGGAVAIVAGLDRSATLPARDVVEIAARAFDESTGLRQSKGVATGKLQLTRRPTATGMVHYDVATRLDLAPGRYEIRLAMDSPAARQTGSAFAFVTVPDFVKAPLTLSGVVLGRLPLTRPTGKDPLNGLVPFIPTTTRTFLRTDRVGALLRIYQGGKDPTVPVAIKTRLTDRTDRTVFEQAATVTPDSFLATARTAEHRIELPLTRLEPGEYLLSLDASAGRVSQVRHVRLHMN